MSGRPLNVFEAARMAGDEDYCRVAQTWLYGNGCEICVSTVFLVLATEPADTLPPLFETMIFVEDTFVRGANVIDSIFGYRPRVMTFDEALAQHVKHVELLRLTGARLGLPDATLRGVMSTEGQVSG